MTLLSNKPASVAAGTNNTLTINKTQLVNLINNSGDVNAAYYADESNWKRVIFYYQDSSKKQKTVVMFDTDSNTGRFKPSRKSKYNKWQLRRIVIEDKDNGIFALSRTISSATTALNQQEIEVISPNVAPTGIMLAGAVNNAFTMQEGSTFVSNLAAVDENMNDAHTFSIVAGQDSAYFEIIGNNALHFKAPADFESGKTSYTVTIKVSDSEGLETLETFTVNVTDVDEAPPLESFVASTSEIKEFNAKNQTVAVLAAIDPDGLGSFTFSLVSGQGDSDNSYFYIEGNKLKANTSFVYGSKNSYSVRIRVTDVGGISTEKVFSFSLVEVVSANARTVFFMDSYWRVGATTPGSNSVYCPPSRRISPDGKTIICGAKIFKTAGILSDGLYEWDELDTEPLGGNAVLSPDGEFLFCWTTSLGQMYRKKGVYSSNLIQSFSGFRAVNFTEDSNYLCAADNNYVYVYKKTINNENNNPIWTLRQKFTHKVNLSDTLFPLSIEFFSDKTLFLGVSKTFSTTKRGAIFVYSWNQESENYNTNYIEIQAPDNSLDFGNNIQKINESVFLTSAPGGISMPGKVFVFKKILNQWQNSQTITKNVNNDGFGIDISNYRNKTLIIKSRNSNEYVICKNNGTDTNPSFIFQPAPTTSLSATSINPGTDHPVVTDVSVHLNPFDTGIILSNSNPAGRVTGTSRRLRVKSSTRSLLTLASNNFLFTNNGGSLSFVYWNKQENSFLYDFPITTNTSSGSLSQIIAGYTTALEFSLDKKYIFAPYQQFGSVWKNSVKIFKNIQTDDTNPPIWQEEFSYSGSNVDSFRHKFQINDEGNVFGFIDYVIATGVEGRKVIRIYEKNNGTWNLSHTFGSTVEKNISNFAMNKTGDLIVFTDFSVLKIFKKINNTWTAISTSGLQNWTGTASTGVLLSGVAPFGFDADDNLLINASYYSTSQASLRASYSGMHVYKINYLNNLEFLYNFQPNSFYGHIGFFGQKSLSGDRTKLFTTFTAYDSATTTDIQPILYFVKKDIWKKMTTISSIKGFELKGATYVQTMSDGNGAFVTYRPGGNLANTTHSVISITNQPDNEYFTKESEFKVDSTESNKPSKPVLNTDGTTMAIGIPLANKVKIYTKNEKNQWVIQQILNGSGDSGYTVAGFGFSVAISDDGNTLAVGAPETSHSGVAKKGCVFIFKRTGNTWNQVTQINYNTTKQAEFGTSVSLNAAGTKLAVGAPYGGTYTSTTYPTKAHGAACIYYLSNNTWSFNRELDQSPGSGYLSVSQLDMFGKKVNLSPSGETVAVYNQNYRFYENGSNATLPGCLVVENLTLNQRKVFYQSSALFYSFQSFHIFSDDIFYLVTNTLNLHRYQKSTASGVSYNFAWSYTSTTPPAIGYEMKNDIGFSEVTPINDGDMFINNTEDFLRINYHNFYKKINNTWTSYDALVPHEYQPYGGYLSSSKDGITTVMTADRDVLTFKKD